MKATYLDFDGVLNSLRYYREKGIDIKKLNEDFKSSNIVLDSEEYFEIMARCLDPVAVSYLNEITRLSGSKIVLITDWLKDHPLERLTLLLKRVGVEAPIIGAIPKIGVTRKGGILLHSRSHRVSRFVILEDAHEMGELEPLTVRTKLEHGLLKSDIRRALAILERT